MRLLTLTNLYPSEGQPRHGIFVEERLRQLVLRDIEARVIALRPAVPWLRGDEKACLRHGIAVEYVHVPTLPLLTNWIDPWLWAAAVERHVERAIGGNPEGVVLDAHFLYPDGAAAAIVGRRLGVPVVITARGSDVNVKCASSIMRAWAKWTAMNAAAVITVSSALARRLEEHGIRAPILEVLPNGVDLEKFRPLDRRAAQARFGVQGRVLASVGHLVPEKGHGIAIEAMPVLPDTTLMIVGAGPERGRLEELASKRGVSSRVRFLGLVPHTDMPAVYAAADVLILPSLREGMPNVVLESLACGTPVVATDVGGVGEVVTERVAGRLMADRSAASLVESVTAVLESGVSRADVRRFGERFSWHDVVDRQAALYGRVLESRGGAPSAALGRA